MLMYASIWNQWHIKLMTAMIPGIRRRNGDYYVVMKYTHHLWSNKVLFEGRLKLVANSITTIKKGKNVSKTGI